MSKLHHCWPSVLAGAVFTASGLSACSTGPAYLAPVLQLAPFKANQQAASLATSLATPPLDAYWTAFHDPVLTRIVQRCLAENLDLAAAAARVAQARAGARAAGAALLPTVELENQTTTMHQSVRSPIGRLASARPAYQRNASVFDAGLGASWETDLSGGLHQASAAAMAEYAAAQAGQLGVRVSLAAEAADAYFQVRDAQAQLALINEQIAIEQHLLALVQSRRETGTATEREVQQAQAQLFHAQTALAPVNIRLEAQLNRLDVLQGAQPGTFSAELRAAASATAIPALPSQMTPAAMLRQRPDILAAERRLAASNARIGVAIAGYYPSFSLGGLLGFDSLGAGVNPAHLFSAASFQPQLLTGLRWRLFDFGKVDAEVDMAKSANGAALADYRQTVLRAAQDVEDSITTYVQLSLQQHSIDDELGALQRARDAAQRAYRAGAIPLTDVLLDDRDILSIRLDAARTHADTLRASVNCFRAMGGGWSLPAD